MGEEDSETKEYSLPSNSGENWQWAEDLILVWQLASYTANISKILRESFEAFQDNKRSSCR